MKPNAGGMALALAACMALAFLPACGTLRPATDPGTRMVAVTEPGGATYAVPAASVEVAKIHRHAGEWCCPDFDCPGDGWSELIILGFYALYYACYFIGYGLYWCADAIYEACAESGEDADQN